MAWNNASAYVTAIGAQVRVGVQKIGKGNPRLMVSIGAKLYGDLGEPDSVNVFVGDGDDAGRLLLQFDDDGAVEFRRGKKGGAVVKLNRVDGMPTVAMKMTGVKYDELEAEDTGNKQISIILPW